MGKAKRFNLYDETIKSGRERVKAFGEARQKLSIGSSFRSPPLSPTTQTAFGDTGTGDGTFLTASLAADQTVNIAVNNHIEFDTKDEDGEIVLQTGVGQADGIFELSSGKKYFLEASLRPEFSGTTGQLEVAWFDQTNSAEIGSRAKYETQTGGSHNANQSVASATVTPATNILVKVEILSVTALTALANEYCHANLFEISLGGFGAGAGGGGGVSFPITPDINDHGNVGTVTEDLDLSATTGHIHKLTLTGNPTLTFSNPPASGTQIEFEIELVQDSTGGRTVTFPASVVETVVFPGTADTTTILTGRTNDGGTNYHIIPALRGTITVGGDFAQQDLSNLSGVSINTSLISDADDTDDLGSSGKEWKDLYIDGTANIDALSMGGDVTMGGFDIKNVDILSFDSADQMNIVDDGGTTMAFDVDISDKFEFRINAVPNLTIDADDIDVQDNNIVDCRNLNFTTNGQSAPTNADIHADASGDMVFNVASPDQFFWTVNGSNTVIMQHITGFLDINNPTSSMTVTIANLDTTPTDLDQVGDIRFRADNDAGGVTANSYGRILVNMDDVTSTEMDGRMTIQVMEGTGNALADYITLNALANEKIRIHKTLEFGALSGQELSFDGTGIQYDVPTSDTHQFQVNSVEKLKIESGRLLITHTGQPDLDIFRDDSTPNNGDPLGVVSFFGNDSTAVKTEFAAIQGEARVVTNGSEEGALRFFARDAASLVLKMELDKTGVGFFGHATAGQSAAYTPTNVTTDRAFDANSTNTAEIADVLGTLIADLQSMGIVGEV